MQTLLFILLTICKFNSLRCELSDTPGMVANDIDNDEPSNGDVSTLIGNEGYLPDPLSSINIDYTNNALILHFRKNDQNLDGDDKRRSLLDKNFMRFGRSGSGSLMRFGKRQAESLDADLAFQVDTGGRESRGDNFLRFGRSAGNLMRFGRAEGNVGPLGSGVQNRIKLSRQPLQNPMRFGRSLDRNLMRFGRGTDSSLMRFGRPDQSFMRFGRNNGNLMRFGRPDSFMRLGRTDPHLMRFGRNDKNFMRFGKLDQNFMRFGKRVAGLQNKTTIPGSEEDSLDKLWQSDASNLSESESEVASESKSENMIPGFVMAQ